MLMQKDFTLPQRNKNSPIFKQLEIPSHRQQIIKLKPDSLPIPLPVSLPMSNSSSLISVDQQAAVGDSDYQVGTCGCDDQASLMLLAPIHGALSSNSSIGTQAAAHFAGIYDDAAAASASCTTVVGNPMQPAAAAPVADWQLDEWAKHSRDIGFERLLAEHQADVAEGPPPEHSVLSEDYDRPAADDDDVAVIGACAAAAEEPPAAAAILVMQPPAAPQFYYAAYQAAQPQMLIPMMMPLPPPAVYMMPAFPPLPYGAGPQQYVVLQQQPAIVAYGI
jgi:hypothetical protein